MATLIDTHAHLDDDQFAADLYSVVARAMSAGVERVIVIGTTAPTSERACQLAVSHATLSAAVGIQPNHVAQAQPTDWDTVVGMVGRPGVVALGETGLDRYWDYAPFPLQEDYFDRHLELSRRTNLPVVIHCRQAEGDVVRMLKDDYERHGEVRGVMHSFTGDWATAEACLGMGLYVSFAGMVTYKNAVDLREVAKRVPLDRLLVETDSPYLTPMPLRGKIKRNEPAHAVHTAELLAQIRGMAFVDLAGATTANARKLFNLPKSTQA